MAFEPEFAVLAAAIEDELINDYVRNRLSVDDRRAFESEYVTSEEQIRKVEFARALAHSFGPAKSISRGLRILATSTALAAVLAASVWFFHLRTVTIDLYPGVVRGMTGEPLVPLSALTRSVRARLHPERHPSGAVTAILRSVGSPVTLWSGRINIALGVAECFIPSRFLLEGQYIVRLDPDSPFPEIFVFRIKK